MNLTRGEVIDHIIMKRTTGQYFIKAWEKGHTFVDIDLIERYLDRSDQESPVEGFELLDMEQMWQTLIDLDPDKLVRVKRLEGEVIEWTWKDSHGNDRKTFYPFTPEGIMTIIDDEFFA